MLAVVLSFAKRIYAEECRKESAAGRILPLFQTMQLAQKTPSAFVEKGCVDRNMLHRVPDRLPYDTYQMRTFLRTGRQQFFLIEL